jgi:alpha-methylacyl-CoA racemase
VLDGGAPFLRPYETADGGHVVVGALEGRFFRELLDRLGIDDLDPAWQYDRRRWPEIERRLAEVFRSRTRAEWVEAFEGSDACCAPVLSLSEATRHPHNVARGTYVEVDGIVQPAPAPRFSRTPSAAPRPPASAGTGAASALAEWNVPAERVSALCEAGVLRVGRP